MSTPFLKFIQGGFPMKVFLRIFCVLALFLFSCMVSSAAEQKSVAVSPGSDVGIAVVGQVCPTFSWTAVEGAAAYRVEVFETQGENRPDYTAAALATLPV